MEIDIFRLRNNLQNNRRIKSAFFLYTLVLILTFIFIPIVYRSRIYITPDIHSTLEITGSFVAIFSGISCMIYYFGLKNRFYLIIGIGFCIVGGESFLHGLISLSILKTAFHIDLSKFLPITGVIGRTMVAMFIILSVFLEKHIEGRKKKIFETVSFIIVFVSIGVLISYVVSWLILPNVIYPNNIISRPLDFISAIIFILTFLIICRRFFLHKDVFSKWLLVYILLSFASELYMSFSIKLYDATYSIAHLITFISYIMPITGIALYGLELIEDIQVEIAKRKAAESHYKNLYQNSNEAIFIVNRNQQFITANPAAIKLIDCKNEEAIKHLTVTDISPEKQEDGSLSSEKADYYINKALKDGYCRFEWLHKKRSGEVFVADIILSPYQSDKETTLQAAMRNITEMKKAEKEIKESMSAKAEFTSIVSHELRTPLTAMKESLSLIQEGCSDIMDKKYKELIDIAIRNVERLARLINDILELQKFEVGKLVLNKSKNDINQVLTNIQQTVSPVIREKKLEIHSSFDSTIIPFLFDADRITQAILNIVNNAIKFTEKGNITIESKSKKDGVLITISDTGIGIADENIDKLFQKYFQIGKGKERRAGGAGLGLSIAHNIISQHDGKIWVKSELQKGSYFYIFLPYSNKEKIL